MSFRSQLINGAASIVSVLCLAPITSADSMIFQRANQPNANYDEVWDAGFMSDDSSAIATRESYLQINGGTSEHYVAYFDISQLPAGASVTDAQLKYNFTFGATGATTMGIYQVTTDWRSGTAWTNAGGDWIDNADQAQGTSAFDAIAPTSNNWHSWDVTTIVQHWVSDGDPNYGFIIFANDLNTQKVKAHGAYKTTATKAQKLIITYDTSGGDTTPPVFVSVGPPVIEGPTEVSIVWETDEPATSQVVYGLQSDLSDGVATNFNSNYEIPHAVNITDLTADQTYYYLVRSQDALTNSADSTIYSFVTPPDTGNTPPTGTISIEDDASITKNSNVTLTLSASDAENSVTEMKFSNDDVSYDLAVAYGPTAQWDLDDAQDGLKTVYVKFKDEDELWSDAFSFTITLDTTAPTIGITSPADNEIIQAQ